MRRAAAPAPEYPCTTSCVSVHAGLPDTLCVGLAQCLPAIIRMSSIEGWLMLQVPKLEQQLFPAFQEVLSNDVQVR